MLKSIALGCGGYEAYMQQNRAENAKPSRFSRVFSEVPGSLRRDKGIQQEIIVLQRITSLDNHIRFITPQDSCPGVFFYHIEIIAKNVEFYNFVDYYNMK